MTRNEMVEVNYKSMTGNRTVEVTSVYHLKTMMNQRVINYVTIDGVITFNMGKVLKTLENGK